MDDRSQMGEGPEDAAIEAARSLSSSILDNVRYVEKELPGLELAGPIRDRIGRTCSALTVLGREILAWEWPVARDQSDSTGWGERTLPQADDRVRTLVKALQPLHELVMALRDAPDAGPDGSSAYVLVAESAANIYVAFTTLRTTLVASNSTSDLTAGRQGDRPAAEGPAPTVQKSRPTTGSWGYFDWKEESFACPDCAWTGQGRETRIGDQFEAGFECLCPRCERKFCFVPFPTDAEALSDPRASEESRRSAVSHQHRLREFERTKLRLPEQLPELDPVPPALTWDLIEIPSTDAYTVIRSGGQEIWRELAWYEGYWRFGEVAIVLQQRYGAALRDLEPSRESELYLYGDKLSSPEFVARVRAELAQGAYVVRE